MLRGFPPYVSPSALSWRETSPTEQISFPGFLSDPRVTPQASSRKRGIPRSPYLLIGSELASFSTSSPHNLAKAGCPKPPKVPCRCHGEPAVLCKQTSAGPKGRHLVLSALQPSQSGLRGRDRLGRQVEGRWEGFFLGIGRVDLPLPECSFFIRDPHYWC